MSSARLLGDWDAGGDVSSVEEFRDDVECCDKDIE
jgi:hypothetical protein